MDGSRGRETRTARAAARDGRAGRVQPDQRQLRRRRLARLLPDARLLLGQRPIRRLRRRPQEAGRLVPRHRRTRQGTTRQPRPIDHRPQPIRRMDRRRRTPRRAIPRPLPTPTRRQPTDYSPTPPRHRPHPRSRRPLPSHRGAAPAAPIDPGQFGQDGTGGTPDAAAQALLQNKNVVLDDVGVSDIKAGRIDPRIVGVLTKLSQEHKIVVSCMCSDHPRLTTGGSVSNHTFGRGLDIASIDGEIVGPGSALAREVASELSQFDPALRPDEIGSPFAINGPGYFTDAAHSEPHPRRLQDRDHARLQAPRRRRAAPQRPQRPQQSRPSRRRSRPSSPRPASPRPSAPDPKKASGPVRRAARAGQGRRRPATRRPAATRTCSCRPSRPRRPSNSHSPRPWRRLPAVDPAAVDLSGAPGAYPGDDAPKEQIAAWMAAEAEKRGLPAQLPVMAALVESEPDQRQLRRRRLARLLPDARLASGTAATTPASPTTRRSRSTGSSTPPNASRRNASAAANRSPTPTSSANGSPTSNAPPSNTAAATNSNSTTANGPARQRPQDTRRTRAAAVAPAAPVAPTGPPMPRSSPLPAMARGAGPKALAALKEAEKYTGTPYKWGGSTPQTGFDCSGLVQWAYAQAGVQIPRVTDAQIAATNGTAVRRSELLPGDLVFFRDASGYVHHVGISMGGDKFLHAPHTGDVVKVSSLDEPYYAQQFTGGRRFDAAGAAAPAAVPAAAAPAARTGGRPGRGRRGAGGRRARRRRGAPAEQRPLQGDQRPGGAQPQGERGRRPGAGERRSRGPASAPPPSAPSRTRGSSSRRSRGSRPRRPRPRPTPPRPPPRPPHPRPSPRPRQPLRAAPVAPEVAAAAPEAPVPAGPPPDLADVPADYPGDDAGQKALAKWLAKRAEKAGLPPELPVMASLVESGVRNLNFGDADSVGFFQMRVGIWNRGEYAGYPKNPGLQAKWFIDTALAVKRQRIAAGDAGFGKDPRQVGRVDRGHRAAGRAVPRPLPAPPRRGAPAAELTAARPPALSPRRRRSRSGRRRRSTAGVVFVRRAASCPASAAPWSCVVGAVVVRRRRRAGRRRGVVEVSGFGFFFTGTFSAGSPAAAGTEAATVASASSMTSAGSSDAAAALDSPPPPPAPAMPNAAANATITTPATMRS